MDLRHLEAFVLVARHEQVNRAAQDLHLSQPALSRQIRALEKDLGVQLFVRHPRGVRLTAAGKVLRAGAEEALGRLESLTEEVRTEAENTVVVRIGIPPGLPQDWFRSRVQGCDHVSLSLFEAPTDEQLSMFEKGALDITLTHVRNPSSASRVVLTQELGVVARTDSGLFRSIGDRDAVGLHDLDNLRVMAHSRGEIRVQEALMKNALKFAGVRAEVPLQGKDASGQDLCVRTWASWAPRPEPEVLDVLAGLFEG